MSARNYSRAFLSLFLIVMLCVCGCGGGGGGGGGDDIEDQGEAPDVPELLNYSVSQQWFEDPDLIRAIFQETTATVTSINLIGDYHRATLDTSLSSNSGMVFRVTPYGELEGLDIGVLIPDGATVRWTGQQDPVAGSLQITIAAGLFDFDRVMVLVNGPSGLTITAFEGPDEVQSATLSWQEFDNVADSDEAPLYQSIASLSYSMWKFIFAHVHLAYTVLSVVVTNDVVIERDGSYMQDGEAFPGTNSSGTLEIDWTDTTGNNELGPGDAFQATFYQWWVDDPTNDIDDLYDGTLTLTGYTETQSSVGGDFKLANFAERETQDDNTILPNIKTVNGGFNLTYSW